MIFWISADFVVALIEAEFGKTIANPIKYSSSYWKKIKFFMMDNAPLFSIYMTIFFAYGLLYFLGASLMKSAKKLRFATGIFLFLSALLVIFGGSLHSLLAQTPHEFMYAQLLIAPLFLGAGGSDGILPRSMSWGLPLLVILLGLHLLAVILLSFKTIWLATLLILPSLYLSLNTNTLSKTKSQ